MLGGGDKGEDGEDQTRVPQPESLPGSSLDWWPGENAQCRSSGQGALPKLRLAHGSVPSLVGTMGQGPLDRLTYRDLDECYLALLCKSEVHHGMHHLSRYILDVPYDLNWLEGEMNEGPEIWEGPTPQENVSQLDCHDFLGKRTMPRAGVNSWLATPTITLRDRKSRLKNIWFYSASLQHLREVY
jgi:hypothetical protein